MYQYETDQALPVFNLDQFVDQLIEQQDNHGEEQ